MSVNKKCPAGKFYLLPAAKRLIAIKTSLLVGILCPCYHHCYSDGNAVHPEEQNTLLGA